MKLSHLLFLLGLLFSHLSLAQTDTLSASEFLQQLEAEHGVFFAYEASMLNGVSIPAPSTKGTLEEQLAYFEKAVNLSVQSEGDSYFLIKPVERQYKMLAYDAKESFTIYSPAITVNGNPQTFSLQGDTTTFSATLSPNDTVTVHALGYEKKSMLGKDLGRQSVLTFAMFSTTYELEETVVRAYLAEGIYANRKEHRLEIKMNELAQLPQETDGDVLVSIQALPGITSPNGKAGNTYIRGSATDQSFVLFDNIPIYHKGHYFGTISPYNSHVVDRINVYRNGFNPNMGGRTGGAIDIHTCDKIEDSLTGGASVNSVYMEGHLATPIIKDKLSLSFSARTNLPVKWQSPKVHAFSRMIFATSKLQNAMKNPYLKMDSLQLSYHDINAKINWKLSKKHSLHWSGIAISNGLDYQLAETTVPETEHVDNTLNNFGSSLRWKANWTKDLTGELSLTYSDYTYDYAMNRLNNDNGQVNVTHANLNNLRNTGLKYQLGYYLKNGDQIEGGYELKSIHTDFLNHNYERYDSVGVLDISQEVSGILQSPFVNYKLNRFKRFKMQVGLRGTHYSNTGEFRFEPRAFANYLLTDKINLKASSGIYDQYVSQVRNMNFNFQNIDQHLWMLANDRNVGVMTGHQHMLGFMYASKKWTLDVEGFYKNVNNIAYLAGRLVTGPNDFYDQIRIQTTGVDLLVKRKFTDRLTAWVSYTYSHNQLSSDSLYMAGYASDYDQPHVLNIVGLYSWRRWKFAASWKFASGLTTLFPGTPQQELPSTIAKGGNNPNAPKDPPPPPKKKPKKAHPYEVHGERYPNIHQLDLSVSYTFRVPKWQGMRGIIGLSIQNVYDQSNVVEVITTTKPDGNTRYQEAEGLGFAPNLMIGVEW